MDNLQILVDVINRVYDTYYEGVKEGITRYAVWKDGTQVVGVMERPLIQVLVEVDREKEQLIRDTTGRI